MSGIRFIVLITPVVISVLCGCGRNLSVAQNRASALALLNQVYMGSFDQMQSQLAPPFQKGNSNSLVSRTSAVLQKRFGSVRDLKLETARQGPLKSAEAIWAVTGERGKFEMKVAFDRDDKVAGLWFRSSSSKPWTPSHMLGFSYPNQW